MNERRISDRVYTPPFQTSGYIQNAQATLCGSSQKKDMSLLAEIDFKQSSLNERLYATLCQLERVEACLIGPRPCAEGDAKDGPKPDALLPSIACKQNASMSLIGQVGSVLDRVESYLGR